MPTIKQLSKVLSDDGALNRVQDQLASALNPILRNVQGDLTGPLEAPKVRGLQGVPIEEFDTPERGSLLVFDGEKWVANGVFMPNGIDSITAASFQFRHTTSFARFECPSGSVTLTSTPTILANGASIGHMVLLMNVGAANNLVIQRGTTYGLSLRNPNLTIGPGGSVILVYNGSVFVDVGHTTNTST
jgi:hypothetical protein